MTNRRSPENRILAALSRSDRARLDSVQQSDFTAPAGTTLFEPGDPIDAVYFLHSGLVSLLILAEDGEETESAAIGHEGVVGLGGLVSGDKSFSRQRVQITAEATRFARMPFLQILHDSRFIRQVMAAHQDAFAAQLLQSAFCNATHTAEQRMARWLLTGFDAVRDGALELTQDSLARSLGLRRATITQALNRASAAGTVRIERGRIELVSRAGLEMAACSCYRIIRETHERVLSFHH